MAKVIFVSEDKLKRAQEILAVVNGTKGVVAGETTAEIVARYKTLLAEAKIEGSSEEAIEFVYQKLGGLVRTEAEQKEAEKKKAEAQSKSKRR